MVEKKKIYKDLIEYENVPKGFLGQYAMAAQLKTSTAIMGYLFVEIQSAFEATPETEQYFKVSYKNEATGKKITVTFETEKVKKYHPAIGDGVSIVLCEDQKPAVKKLDLVANLVGHKKEKTKPHNITSFGNSTPSEGSHKKKGFPTFGWTKE